MCILRTLGKFNYPDKFNNQIRCTNELKSTDYSGYFMDTNMYQEHVTRHVLNLHVLCYTTLPLKLTNADEAVISRVIVII